MTAQFRPQCKTGALSALLVLLLATAAIASRPSLKVEGHTWPGGALFVSVDHVGKNATGTWYWAGNHGPLDWAPYGLRTGLAVPLGASMGGIATLRIVVHESNGKTDHLARRLRIAKIWRPTQYLRLSAATNARFSDPLADKQEDLALAALRHLIRGAMWHRDFAWPVHGPRSTPFGVRRIRNGQVAGYHMGIDFAVAYGTPVKAPADGVASLVGHHFVLLGNCVILNHGDGLTSLYLHLSKILIKKGEHVKRGQVIGLVGTTGASTGPHLHYATYFQGNPIDPDLLRHIPRDWDPDTWRG